MFIRRASAITIVFVALALGGCGGSSDGAASDHTATSAPRSTTTVAPTTTTTVPPPYSFDDSVPPPKLINTGTDYASIARSLDQYGRWLLAHHPEPSLLSEAYVVGTPVYDRFLNDVSTAKSQTLRLVDVNDELTIRVVGVALPIVSLQITEHADSIRAIGRSGSVVDEKPYPSTPYRWLTTLQADSHGRFRIASAELAEPNTRVSP